MRRCVVCFEETAATYYQDDRVLCFHCWKDALYVPRGSVLETIQAAFFFPFVLFGLILKRGSKFTG